MTSDQHQPFETPESPEPAAAAAADSEEIGELSGEDTPARRRRRGWRRWAVGAVAVAVIAAGALFATGRVARGEENAADEAAEAEQAKEEKAPIPVEIAVVGTGPVASYIAATANLLAEGEVKVLAEVEGRVTRILAAEGDRVAKGDLLAVLDRGDAEIALEKARVREANAVAAHRLPPGYTWGWNDRILEQEGQDQQMAVNFLLALLLVYLVMASLFESLAQPFAILLSILFALPGAAWMLAATGTSFNLMAQIGLLILMGIVVNNGIVLLDHVNRLRAAGLPRDQAILSAGRDRLRPILMTATTTIIGLVPLAIRGATVGDVFYFPSPAR